MLSIIFRVAAAQTRTASMDSFDNFQYDSASSYGGAHSVVDDNSSVYTATTNNPVDLSSLSVADDRSVVSSTDHNGHHHHASRSTIDEDFDAVLDDLKDEGSVDLPPHACRCANHLTSPLCS